MIERQRSRRDDQASRRDELRQQLKETEAKISRLLDAIQEGFVQEGDLIRDRMYKLEQDRSEIVRLIASLEQRETIAPNLLSEKTIRIFEQVLKERLRSEDPSLRKA